MANEKEVKMSWELSLSFLGISIIFGFTVGLLLLWNREEPKETKKKTGWKGDDCQ